MRPPPRPQRRGSATGARPRRPAPRRFAPAVPSVVFFWVGQEASATMELTWVGNICAGLTVDADVPWARGALVERALRVELRALGTAHADAAPKVLVIGIDGVRGDAMEGATLPGLRSLLRHAAASFHASAQRTGPTSSGPG